LVTLSKNFRTKVLGSVVIQLYAGECTPSVDHVIPNMASMAYNERFISVQAHWDQI